MEEYDDGNEQLHLYENEIATQKERIARTNKLNDRVMKKLATTMNEAERLDMEVRDYNFWITDVFVINT